MPLSIHRISKDYSQSHWQVSVSHWLLQEALVPSHVGISTSFLSALLPWQLAFHQVSCLKKRQLKTEAAVF